ncbi:hypothetical protein FI667_g12827, partial [Globisporangium splendens]
MNTQKKEPNRLFLVPGAISEQCTFTAAAVTNRASSERPPRATGWMVAPHEASGDAEHETTSAHVPPSDIDKCIRFSFLRCVVSLCSFALVMTDIPRTGLGLRSMSDRFNPVSTDTVMYFGPYAYQVAHISRNASGDTLEYAGACEGERIDTLDLWAYKYDSLSISTSPRLFEAENVLHTRPLTRAMVCADARQSLPTTIDTSAVVESDASQWFFFTSVLRATSQLYIWACIVLLWLGCFKVRSAEKRLRAAGLRAQLLCTWQTFLKIPSHVIVHGSWVPVTCYALAHYIDCALTHLLNDNMWASVNGVIDSDPVQYALVALIQMRNIWFLSLVVKVAVISHGCFLGSQAARWNPRDGIVGIRETLIGVVAGLTVFGPLRTRSFRDLSVLKIEILSDPFPMKGDVAVDKLWSKWSMMVYWRVRLVSQAVRSPVQHLDFNRHSSAHYSRFRTKIAPRTPVASERIQQPKILLFASLQSTGECQLGCLAHRGEIKYAGSSFRDAPITTTSSILSREQESTGPSFGS